MRPVLDIDEDYEFAMSNYAEASFFVDVEIVGQLIDAELNNLGALCAPARHRDW